MKYLYVVLMILLIITLSCEISNAYYGGYFFPGYYPYFAPLANEAFYNSVQEKGSYSNEERNLNGTLPDTLTGLEFVSLAPPCRRKVHLGVVQNSWRNCGPKPVGFLTCMHCLVV